MAFASGQRVTAVMLNRITRNTLEALMTADDTIVAGEADLSGLTLSVTTIQPNTLLKITASLDWGCNGTTDFSAVRLYVNGVVQPDEMNRGTNASRSPAAKTWSVNVASASTVTVKLTGRKLISGNTTTIYAMHSNLIVSGNGIS